MHCANCSKDTVVSIRMRVGGEDVTFRRCSLCETNQWDALDGEKGLDEILELAKAGR
jgi:hypothetical protein